VGGDQSEIEAFEAGQREPYHECRSAKENCGCAKEEMGAGEGEQSQLTKQQGDQSCEGSRLEGHQ